MGENRMAEVAKMFGKRLGERFDVTWANGQRLYGYISSGVAFTHDGLFCEDRPCESMLMDLLTGKAVVEGDRGNGKT